MAPFLLASGPTEVTDYDIDCVISEDTSDIAAIRCSGMICLVKLITLWTPCVFHTATRPCYQAARDIKRASTIVLWAITELYKNLNQFSRELLNEVLELVCTTIAGMKEHIRTAEYGDVIGNLLFKLQALLTEDVKYAGLDVCNKILRNMFADKIDEFCIDSVERFDNVYKEVCDPRHNKAQIEALLLQEMRLGSSQPHHFSSAMDNT